VNRWESHCWESYLASKLLGERVFRQVGRVSPFVGPLSDKTSPSQEVTEKSIEKREHIFHGIMLVYAVQEWNSCLVLDAGAGLILPRFPASRASTLGTPD
jgi:hypothetical protein